MPRYIHIICRCVCEGVSKRLAFYLAGWINKIYSHQCGQVLSNPLKAQTWQGSGRVNSLCLLELGWDIFLFAEIRAPGSWGFKSQDLYTWLLWFSGFQNYTTVSSGFPAFIWQSWDLLSSITIWANFHNNSSHIAIYILFVLFLWRTLLCSLSLLCGTGYFLVLDLNSGQLSWPF